MTIWIKSLQKLILINNNNNQISSYFDFMLLEMQYVVGLQVKFHPSWFPRADADSLPVLPSRDCLSFLAVM